MMDGVVRIALLAVAPTIALGMGCAAIQAVSVKWATLVATVPFHCVPMHALVMVAVMTGHVLVMLDSWAMTAHSLSVPEDVGSESTVTMVSAPATLA